MEVLTPILGILAQLAFFGLIVWAVVRALGRRPDTGDRVDHATTVRRLFVYGLLFATLVSAATGATFVLEELTGSAPDRADDDRSTLALGLALLIVAGPTHGFLLRHARRRLRDTRGERESLAWRGYLNLTLLVSLVITTVAGQRLLEELVGVGDRELASAAPVVVWGAVWAFHWFVLVPAHGIPGDSHLASGSLTGLVTLAVGLGGLAYVAGDEIYTRVVEQVPIGHDEPEPGRWIAATVVGGIVWAWHWLRHYRDAPRTGTWHVHVVLFGALGGLVAAVVAGATLVYRTLVWFVGDPVDELSSLHFEFVPVATAVLVVGLLSWGYHLAELRRGGRGIERTEPQRASEYLTAGAGLVGTVIAVTLALVALLEEITPEPDLTETRIANRLILAATLAAIGGPIWWFVWTRIQRRARRNPAAELGSPVRRIHLVTLFGVGGTVVLVSLISVLFVGIDDLLEGAFGGETVRSFRVGLALIVTVTGVAWYHLRVFRADRDMLRTIEPAAPPPPTRHVVLVGPRGAVPVGTLAAATGAAVDRWNRADDISLPAVDLDELRDRIDATDADTVLVVLGPADPIVVPVEPRTDPAG